MEKNQEKLNDIDRKVVTSLLEKDVIERKLENNSKQKIIENDNVQLINQINKYFYNHLQAWKRHKDGSSQNLWIREHQRAE